MKKVIAIYNAPQECGCPFITFINAENGQVIDAVDLEYEDLFYEAGVERVVRYQATGNERVRKFYSTKLPEVGEVVSTMRRKLWVVDDVNLIKEDDRIMHTFVGQTHEIEVIEVVEWKYLDHNKDEYIQKMTELGFDMTGWCHYKRLKTNHMDFLKAIVKTYNKDWEILNLIKI